MPVGADTPGTTQPGLVCGETSVRAGAAKLNNLVEQDHRAVKRITRPMLGLKTFRCARIGVVVPSCNLVRLGAKSPYTTSTCDSRQCAAGRFAQLLDFIERLDVRRVNWRKNYDYPALESARHRLVSHYCRNATSELKLFWRL